MCKACNFSIENVLYVSYDTVPQNKYIEVCHFLKLD